MSESLRTWSIRLLLLTAVLHFMVNKVLPSVYLATGQGGVFPQFASLVVSNCLALLIAILLFDVGYFMRRLHPLVSTLLITSGLVVPVSVIVSASASNWLSIGVGALALLTIGAMAFRREMPFRVYNALAWYLGTWTLSALLAYVIPFMTDTSPAWLHVVAGASASIAAVTFFLAWCLPLTSITKRRGVASLVASLDFALLFGFGGLITANIMLVATGLPIVLPLVIYSLSVFLLTATVLNLLSSKETSGRGIAVMLLVLSGFAFLEITDIMLAVLSLTLLVFSYPVREQKLWTLWKQALAAEVTD